MQSNQRLDTPVSFPGKSKAREKWLISDEQFNQLYPPWIQSLSGKHWTPLSVSRKAASFLAAEKNSRILDIGSGVGKFCLSAACFSPDAFYTGIEQRKNLVEYADNAKKKLGLTNCAFIYGNFTQVNFREYDHFYFYNAFYENLTGTYKIDESIEYSGELFNYYNRYLFRQLDMKPAGTRLATFHSLEDEVPPAYHIVGTAFDQLLKFWIKV